MLEGAVFFDRDGVLIETSVVEGMPIADNDPEAISFVPGAIELCKSLHKANIKTFLVTNQPDVARGKVSLSLIDSMNRIVQDACKLTATAVCPHDDSDNCNCRKPKPGMVLALAEQFNVDLGQSVFIGDRWRDIEAGNSAGCHTIFIDFQYGESLKSRPTHIVNSLVQAGLLLKNYFQLEETEDL
jgi:D-glycero-D-manno-heptose 1,7-bisphosphate phosphatase